MAVDRRNPLKDLAQLQDKMNRIFEDSLSLLRTGEGKELFALGSWVPPVDIYETEETIVLSAELPGMKKEDMSVEIKDNTLTIKGERKFERIARQKVTVALSVLMEPSRGCSPCRTWYSRTRLKPDMRTAFLKSFC